MELEPFWFLTVHLLRAAINKLKVVALSCKKKKKKKKNPNFYRITTVDGIPKST